MSDAMTAAIEVAAKTQFERISVESWDSASETTQNLYLADAERAITAALPYLLAPIKEQSNEV